MGGIPIDWSAGANMDPQGPLGVVNQGYAGAEEGYKLGQQAAVRHALNGINFNDPASMQNAVSGLIKAGAFDAANSAQTLGVSQQLYPAITKRILGRLNQPQTDTSSAAAPAPAAAAAPQGTPDYSDAMDRHGQIMGDAAQAVQQLQALPLTERPAAAQQIRANFIQNYGVPAGAVDDHLNDLSDEGLKATGQYFADHANWMQTQAQPGATPTAAPAHPTDFAWANDLMHDPVMNDPYVVGMMKKIGLDPTETLNRAQQLIAPWNTQAAQTANTGPQEEAKQAVDLAFKIPGAIIAAKQAGMVASAELAARSPGEFIEVKTPNGPVQVRRDWAMGYAAAHGGVLSTGLSPSEEKFQGERGGQAAELLKADQDSYQAANDSLMTAHRALEVVKARKFDAATPARVQIANALRVAGAPGADRYASDMASFQQATAQAITTQAHAAFPGQKITDKDINLVKQAVGSLTDPNEVAAVAFGNQAVRAQRTMQIEQFKADYAGKHTPEDIQRAWLKGPGGYSPLQSPEWANIPMGGRPAFNPATDVKIINGQRIGMWGVGTGHPVYFRMH